MGNDDFNTTICAVCTPLSEGAISIIRISGSGAFDIADKVFVNKDHKHLLKGCETHTVHYGFITDIRNIVGNKDSIIDEVLVTVMKAPIIYTERKDGVIPEYDIRTDRFDMALDATGAIQASNYLKRMKGIAEREGRFYDHKTNKIIDKPNEPTN